jgi:hypothetical protein
MLKILLFRFWPVLIPLVVYWLWHRTHVAKAIRDNKPVPHFRDGPWYWMVLATLLVSVGCFVWWSASTEQAKGHYVPAHMEKGTLVPGHVGQEP